MQKKIKILSVVSLMSAMIFTVASGAAIDRQTSIPNVHYVDEEWYIKENSHLLRNKEVKDLRDIVSITTDESKGVKQGAGTVWGEPYAAGKPEKYVYVDASKKSSNLYGSNFYAENTYTLKFSKMFVDRNSGKYVDLVMKGDSTNLSAVGYEPFTRQSSPIISVGDKNIYFDGLSAKHSGKITFELRYNDSGNLYDKDTMMCFRDLDTHSEQVRMNTGFDGNYYVPGIQSSDWRLKSTTDGFIGNSTTLPDDDTFKTGFAFYVHHGKITLEAQAESAGFEIGANGVEDKLGSLKIIKTR